MNRLIFVAVLFLTSALLGAVPAAAEGYQPQSPTAQIGQVKVKLSGPPSFTRFDGQDESLDSIILATQPPVAAVMALFAEPEAFRDYSEGQTSGRTIGLNCYALIATPIPLADAETSLAEFKEIEAETLKNMGLESGRLTKSLSQDLSQAVEGVGNHQLQKAEGIIKSGRLLESGPQFFTYLLETSMEIKVKGQSEGSVSNSFTASSMVLVGGKIIQIQLLADSQKYREEDVIETAQKWRADFIKRNSGLKNK